MKKQLTVLQKTILWQRIEDDDASALVGGNSGQKLLSHELTHAGQQRDSVASSQTRVIFIFV
ncbi:DUF4157 domain-containing protein [Microcoleus sp. FACHB-SPT15]|uniref:eCIS core domain-containing protein n=1 Tax=Microcoleus sp. FACHB-SPT15 TaxID=2692830 RepID=UPI00177D524A|nr:DUF4157 domain-containing protein [Microcoleus sp. FACHB-SPT15]MBD1806504.1 DUF4157 domain-containing protein [Microcoleus sp. FACHB-SPT15]